MFWGNAKGYHFDLAERKGVHFDLGVYNEEPFRFWDSGIHFKLSRCASCVARCIPPCDLCASFRNPQGQTISSWIHVYLCVCPKISTALKVFGPKKY
jgi:hypothetical protein